jgi:hypothetical protein
MISSFANSSRNMAVAKLPAGRRNCKQASNRASFVASIISLLLYSSNRKWQSVAVTCPTPRHKQILIINLDGNNNMDNKLDDSNVILDCINNIMFV